MFLLALGLASCREEEDKGERSLGFDEFAPRYNAYIKRWLEKEKAGCEKQLAELDGKVAKGEMTADERKEEEAALRRALERAEFRLSLGDYFAFKKPGDIPEGLAWENGMDEPEMGDPRAKKGGTFYHYMMEFPATLRPFGPKSNHSFRGNLYDDIELSSVGMHPVTRKIIPSVAKEWAVGPDGRTVFYRLDPDAAFNDGVKVRPEDFMTNVYIRISDFVSTPYMKQYFREQVAQVATYGDGRTYSVTLPEEKPYLPLFASLSPAASHFYKDYGPDYTERYQWKVPPTTGAYFVRDEDIRKGVSITLTRAKDWWARDKKFTKNAYNPDHIVYTVVRDDPKAFELFRAGKIDVFFLGRPEFWYEKSEIPPVHDGYIERYQFYTQYPRFPTGLYLNLARPKLQDLDYRLGVQHAMNWRKVIDALYRGDASRIENFTFGFGEMTDPSIRARRFSVTKAREHFRKAGYTEEGSDGILKKPSGERLTLVVTYGNSAPIITRVLSLLAEEAGKAGLDLQLDAMEPTVSYKKVMDKQHEATYWGWGVGPPLPNYYQFFHSSNAFDSKGNPKANTNNINCYKNPRMDVLAKATRNARTKEEFKTAAWEAQKIIHDEAFYSPGLTNDFLRMASWRWVRWPDTPETPFNVPLIGNPLESYLFWIDEDVKKETLAAKRAGKTFPEVQKTIDKFRQKPEGGGN